MTSKITFSGCWTGAVTTRFVVAIVFLAMSGQLPADQTANPATIQAAIQAANHPSGVVASKAGVSAATTGSQALSMQLIVMPPGAAGKPHIHLGYEAAIFILEGEVLTRYGDGLSQSIVSRAGEFLFIPANVPHQPVNLSRTTPARAIIARNYPAMKGPTKPYVGPAGN